MTFEKTNKLLHVFVRNHSIVYLFDNAFFYLYFNIVNVIR